MELDFKKVSNIKFYIQNRFSNNEVPMGNNYALEQLKKMNVKQGEVYKLKPTVNNSILTSLKAIEVTEDKCVLKIIGRG